VSLSWVARVASMEKDVYDGRLHKTISVIDITTNIVIAIVPVRTVPANTGQCICPLPVIKPVILPSQEKYNFLKAKEGQFSLTC
jgi:hypothetical protein